MNSNTELVTKDYKTSPTVFRIDTQKQRDRKRRIAINTADLHHRRIAKEHHLKAYAVTLTYRINRDFQSRNISKYLDCVRSWLRRRCLPLLYLWTLEVAGRLHYHLQLWLPSSGHTYKKLLKGWWPYGSTWIESCRRGSAWAAYIAKPLNTKKLPRGARSYGVGGLDTEAKQALNRARLPSWLKRSTDSSRQIVEVRGKGWIDKGTGQVFKSPWIAMPKIGGFRWVLRSETP